MLKVQVAATFFSGLLAVNSIRDHERVLARHRRQGETRALSSRFSGSLLKDLEMQHAFEFSAETAEKFAFGSKTSRQGLLTRLLPYFAPENQLPEWDSNFLSSS
jgi:hypothetical protein